MIKYRILFMACCMLFIYSLNAQILSIDSCLAMARRNYPLVNQYELINKTKQYSINNVNKGYLPQVNFAAQATWQSDVTSLPINMPGLNIEQLSQYQSKIYGELTQSVTNMFTLKYNKKLVQTNSLIDKQKIEVEIYSLRQRVNNLFFGILLIDAQIKQTELLKADIQIGIDNINTAIANGLALNSDANNLMAQLLKNSQHLIELKATRVGYVQMLELFIGQNITDTARFILPGNVVFTDTIARPELDLYNYQKQLTLVNSKLVTVKNIPRLNLFLQAGYGRPGLNMLSNNYSNYLIGGVKLVWNFSGLYTYKTERKMLMVNHDIVNTQQQTFLFNTNITASQQNTEILKIKELLVLDSEIVDLHSQIKNTAQNQLKFGTVTTNDYLLAINNFDKANQTYILHQIQLLMAQYNLSTTIGKY